MALKSNEILVNRRSIRLYLDREIDLELLLEVLQSVSDAPTSMNRPACYMVVIRNTEKLRLLSQIRNKSSQPIGNAPYAIAVVADTSITKRPVDDAIIASYHLMLSAYTHGLGTCYIADMNRDEVKNILDIPLEHYIGTITPIGYPNENPEMPEKSSILDRTRFLD